MTTIPVLGVNGASAMPTDRRPRARRILAAAAETGAVIIAGTEFDDLVADDLDDVLGPEWWWQHDNAPARDGLLIAGRHTRCAARSVDYFPGAPASPVNAVREILRVRVEVDQRWSFTLADLHAPKDPHGAGWHAHAEMIRNSRKVGADLLIGDFNVARPAMRRCYPDRTIRTAGVLHMAGAERLVLGGARSIDLLPGETGDDHAGLKVAVHPRTRRR